MRKRTYIAFQRIYVINISFWIKNPRSREFPSKNCIWNATIIIASKWHSAHFCRVIFESQGRFVFAVCFSSLIVSFTFRRLILMGEGTQQTCSQCLGLRAFNGLGPFEVGCALWQLIVFFCGWKESCLALCT